MAIAKAQNASIEQIRDGWINPEGDTALNPIYVSTTSFKVDGDLTDVFTAGRGVQLTFHTSGVKTILVKSSSYDSGLDKTTIVVYGDVLVNEAIDELLISISTFAPNEYRGFVSRGDTAAYDLEQGSMIMDNAWHTWDLSAIVPDGAKLVLIRVVASDPTAGTTWRIRTYGFANYNNCARGFIIGADKYHAWDVWVAPDSAGRVEYHCNGAFTTLRFTVGGWIM